MINQKVISIREDGTYFFTSRNGNTIICSFIWPFLESYYITLICLLHFSPQKLFKEDLVSKIQQNLEKLYRIGKCVYIESRSKDVINNAINAFTELKICSFKDGLAVHEDTLLLYLEKLEKFLEKWKTAAFPTFAKL